MIKQQTEKAGFPVKKLFTGGRTLSTVMFWVAYFMTLLVMYALSTWLPKLMVGAGYELGSSLLFLVTLNLGAVTGAILGGKIADMIGSRKVLVTFFFLGFVSLTLLSFKPSMFWLYVLIALAGATTTGTQIVMNAYVSQYYPTEIRSTGLGWALGIGRFGGMLGPTLGGFLLNAQLTLQMNFLAFAIPSILAGIAIWFVQEKYSPLSEKKSYSQLVKKLKKDETDFCFFFFTLRKFNFFKGLNYKKKRPSGHAAGASTFAIRG